jgi:hypothetical protein
VIEGHLVVLDGGRKLRIADDAAGQLLWPTAEEAARAREASARAREASARARITELERELARKRGK